MRSYEGSRPFEAIQHWIFPEKIWMRFSLWVVKTNFCFIKISTCLDQEINLNFLAKEILFIIKIAIRIMHSYLPNVPRGELSTWNFINTDSPYSRFYCQNPPARKVSYSTARWSSTELPISKTQYIQLSPGSAKVYNLILGNPYFGHIWSCLLKVKSALECSLKPIHLGVNWYTLLSRVKNCLCSIREIGLRGTGLEIILWSRKRSISLVVLIILLISTLRLFAYAVTKLGQAVLDLYSGCGPQTVPSNTTFH